MFCAGRVPDEDLKRTMKACGGSIMSTAHDINESVLGQCEYFEEVQIGGERYGKLNVNFMLVIPVVHTFVGFVWLVLCTVSNCA